jgi:hypothetical protein
VHLPPPDLDTPGPVADAPTLLVDAQPLEGDWGAEQIPAQPLEPVVVSWRGGDRILASV